MIKIDIGAYRITQADPYQFTVGKPYTDKKGASLLQNARYFPRLSLAIDYLRQKLTLESDIRSVEEWREADKDARDRLEIYLATSPLKDMEVPQ